MHPRDLGQQLSERGERFGQRRDAPGDDGLQQPAHEGLVVAMEGDEEGRASVVVASEGERVRSTHHDLDQLGVMMELNYQLQEGAASPVARVDEARVRGERLCGEAHAGQEKK